MRREFRLIALFSQLSPRWQTVGVLHSRMKSLGYAVTRRTIQRDLVALEREVPLISDERLESFVVVGNVRAWRRVRQQMRAAA